MNDDGIGIFEELQRKRHHYAAQNEALRRRIMGGGPTAAGPTAAGTTAAGTTAETVNPFDEPPRAPVHSVTPYWRLHSESRIKRRLRAGGELRDDIDVHPLQVVQAVCKLANTTAGELFAVNKKATASRPRQVAMYLVARYCGDLSLTQIAYVFDRHHTTVLHAIRAVPRRIDEGDDKTRAMVQEVEALLRTPRPSVA